MIPYTLSRALIQEFAPESPNRKTYQEGRRRLWAQAWKVEKSQNCYNQPAEVEEKSFPDSVFLSENKESQIPYVLPLYVVEGIICIYKSLLPP